MSVASSVPEGASPPPEPPPRDYGDITVDFRDVDDKVSVDDKLVIDGDVKIRARLEACRQGMIQLEALRTKHMKLMQEMRGRLPAIPGCADVQARIKRTAAISDRSSLQSVDSGVSSLGQTIPSTRCSSPSISHRSSVSCDSACSSLYSNETSPPQAMPYSTYRKLSIEQKESMPQHTDTTPVIPIVATTIASTTGLRSDGVVRAWRRQQQHRPRSMFERSPEQSPRSDSIIDTVSFMQITPPPVHRKMGVVGQPPRSPLAPIRLAVNTSPQASRPLRTAQRPDIVKLLRLRMLMCSFMPVVCSLIVVHHKIVATTASPEVLLATAKIVRRVCSSKSTSRCMRHQSE
ncbi:hypothetical protein KIN20_001491 [Parelaphostrongylus tenuis]|uniref:Uncharacterized protein n=1 Tax=Parelaphostrongylus tenuis TaxID=148309 RepID=A0AAD5MCW0_PARTN|nr:hypothetical protein KIN20_001491 [Parelaphostrongylus tenuis]